MTLPTLLVLGVLTDDPDHRHYGLELSRATGLASGSIYPILARLERVGWLEGGWEEIDRHKAGRPPRYYYRLTETGEQAAHAQLDRITKLREGLTCPRCSGP
jgi:DNA-binding PadR family transcriptional regulator